MYGTVTATTHQLHLSNQTMFRGETILFGDFTKKVFKNVNSAQQDMADYTTIWCKVHCILKVFD